MPPEASAVNTLEELIAEHQRNHPPELVAARTVPRDYEATAELKGDSDRMARLAELAGVEEAPAGLGRPSRPYLLDAAVRGANVTFSVADQDGAITHGFFPLAALAGKRSARKAADQGVVQDRARPRTEPTPGGGTADVPQLEATDDDGGSSGNEPAPEPRPVPEGAPADVEGLNARDTIKLLKSPPEGVDPRVVAEYEQGREKPRASVIAEAEALGLLRGSGGGE